MTARMSEKEWASFTASKYIDPWTGKRRAEADEPLNGLDEYDVLRLMRKLDALRDITHRQTLQMWIGFSALGALICFLHG